MIGRRLLVAAVALAGCAAPSAPDGAVGFARTADKSKPVIDYPNEFVSRESVPTIVAGARTAPRGAGYLAAWITPGFSDTSRAMAIGIGPDGAPLSAAPMELDHTRGEISIQAVACQPGGTCMVLWNDTAVPGLRIATITGEKVSKPATLGEGLPTAVAYDFDAGAYLIVWESDVLKAIHFVDGAPVEPAPLPIGPGYVAPSGVACAPGHGCLVMFEEANDFHTSAVVVQAGTATAPAPIFDRELEKLTYGDGVYFAVTTVSGPGIVRVGLDGVAIDTAAIPLPDFDWTALSLDGAGFDGDAFTVVASSADGTPDASGARTKALRVRADGSSATPASFLLDAFGEPKTFTCADGSCAATLAVDAQGEAAFSAVTFADGVPGAVHPLAEGLTSQAFDAAFAIGDQVIVVWHEGPILRSRWLASDGHAVSAPTDVGEGQVVGSSEVHDDAGLLVILDGDGSMATRVVTSAGVGDEVPIEPPASSRHERAPFAWLEQGVTRAIKLHRFDAAGRALDAEPIDIPKPPRFGLMDVTLGTMSRSDDLFVVSAINSVSAEGTIVRVRDSGEILDVTANRDGDFAGPACSPTECVLIQSLFVPHHPLRNAPLIRRFESHADKVDLTSERLDVGEAGPVVFDGERFVITYATKDEIGVMRLDDDGPHLGIRSREGDSPLVLVPAADRHALLFAASGGGLHLDASLVLVDGFAPPGAGSGGGAGSGEIVASGGACAFDARGAPPPALALLAAALLAALRRRASAPPKRVRCRRLASTVSTGVHEDSQPPRWAIVDPGAPRHQPNSRRISP